MCIIVTTLLHCHAGLLSLHTVHVGQDGLEGLVYGLLTTTHNLGGPVARAIGNQLYGRFNPSISDSSNYIADT